MNGLINRASRGAVTRVRMLAGVGAAALTLTLTAPTSAFAQGQVSSSAMATDIQHHYRSMKHRVPA